MIFTRLFPFSLFVSATFDSMVSVCLNNFFPNHGSLKVKASKEIVSQEKRDFDFKIYKEINSVAGMIDKLMQIYGPKKSIFWYDMKMADTATEAVSYMHYNYND